jgi:pyruvate kinase
VQTKIVATIGPACAGEDHLAALIEAGVNVFRLNMAHADRREHEGNLCAVRRASQHAGKPVAVLMDLAGPKMRLGELPGGQLQCNVGARVRFVRSAASGSATADCPQLTTTYEPLIDELAKGDRVMLADGTVGLVVEAIAADYAECRVLQPGLLRSRQGVNLPGVKLSVPALGPADRENALWGARNEVDFVGLSFVRAAEDVRQLKTLLREAGSGAQVIAKIEKPEALEHLDEIVAAADGVMVARGDLGVEIDIARVAVVQKEIIAECRRRRKPVIIATQMLDSMQHSRLPTRAEVADVANAILDGADACMLSGETAIGEYPREAVEMMRRIAAATEPLCGGRGLSQVSSDETGTVPFAADAPLPLPPALNLITEATVAAAGDLGQRLGAKLLVVASASGATALALAKNHCGVPAVGVSAAAATLRRICLYWGIWPVADAPLGDTAALVRFITDWGRAAGLLHCGDRIVLIAGTGLPVTAHNMILVHQLA